MKDLLAETAARSVRYSAAAGNMRVAPQPRNVARLEALGGALPQNPSDPAEVLALLDDVGSPATVATAGGRYFGFVIGGSLPAALAANWLAGAWDQNAAMQVMSPVAAKIGRNCLGLDYGPAGSAVRAGGAGFVTGTAMANFSALAAARTALLKHPRMGRRGGWAIWCSADSGSGERGSSRFIAESASVVGVGTFPSVTLVPTDSQGRMRAGALPELDSRTLICIQAGNVNTGAFDPAEEICSRAREAGAWVHVDGAFGLWAAVSPRYAHYCTASPCRFLGH